MARKRPQFNLADLVAIVTIAALALAFVRSFKIRGSAHPVPIVFMIALVILAWSRFRNLRGAPVCEECGRRFVTPRNKPLPQICPQCGQPGFGRGRSRNALAIAYWSVLALALLGVVAVRFFLADILAGSPGPSLFRLAVLGALPGGLLLLLALFLVLHFARVSTNWGRFKPMPCEKCGSISETTGPTEPLICPQCRLRQLPAGRLRTEQVKGFGIIFALLLIVGVLAGFMLPSFSSSASTMSYWTALPIGIVATMVGVPTVFIGTFVVLALVQRRRLRQEPFILASARNAAGQEGEVVRFGPVTVWYTGQVNPAPMLLEVMETSRGHLESFLRREMASQPPVRVLCFEKRSAFESFLKPFAFYLMNWLKAYDGLYIGRPFRIISLCTEEAPYRIIDREKTASSSSCSHFFMESAQGPSPAWQRSGICKILFRNPDFRARLNRKMLVSLAKGTALTADLFTLSDKELFPLLKDCNAHNNFQRLVRPQA